MRTEARPWLLTLTLVVVLAAGCGSTANGHSRRVSRADYGAAWPLTVASGTLGCTEPGAVTFTTDDGTVYWLNGTAGDEASANGWLDVHPIWARDPNPGEKKDIGVLIDAGLKLC